jgi:Zn-dependent protease with chaperone function
MDFFGAEERAKKRTRYLLFLFSLGLAGTIVAAYGFARIAEGFLSNSSAHRYRNNYNRYDSGNSYAEAPLEETPLWQPGLMVAVAFFTSGVVGIASLVKWSELRQGGAAVASGVGGRRVDPHSTDLSERRLLNVVEEMSIAAGLPVPAVYVLDDEPEINAFAAGLTTKDAVVTVSRGTLEKLTRDELQGVVGHEFSHILNGDMRMNMRLTALIFGILVIAIMGRGVLYGMRRSRGKGTAAILAIGVSMFILGYIGYFFGRLIQAAVSRQREFLADASSVQFTRNPAGLMGALHRIGAAGSAMEHHQTAAIGHFFFAQSFRSSFGGLLATHPPLEARIRAIDPNFDGKFVAPPPVAPVAPEKTAHAAVSPAAPAPAGSHFPPIPPILGSLGNGASINPLVLIASAGTLPTTAVNGARNLLGRIPERLRTATRSPVEAPGLLFALLLSAEPAVRDHQVAAISAGANADFARILPEIEPLLRELDSSQRLPLVLLALPALNSLDAASRRNLDQTLDRLVHADLRVTTFGYALQKIVRRTLAAGDNPTAKAVRTYSFSEVSAEINVALSALAHASSDNEAEAAKAFASGASQLKLLEGRLSLLTAGDCGFAQLDSALDRLAAASGPIKKRLLTAAAYVVNADGVLLPGEIELFRAMAASLDVPLPALAA